MVVTKRLWSETAMDGKQAWVVLDPVDVPACWMAVDDEGAEEAPVADELEEQDENSAEAAAAHHQDLAVSAPPFITAAAAALQELPSLASSQSPSEWDDSFVKRVSSAVKLL